MRPSGNFALILKDHLCLLLYSAHSFSHSCPLLFLLTILKQRVRSLGKHGDIFKEPSVAERTSLAKPKNPQDPSDELEHRGIEGFKWVTNVCVHLSLWADIINELKIQRPISEMNKFSEGCVAMNKRCSLFHTWLDTVKVRLKMFCQHAWIDLPGIRKQL